MTPFAPAASAARTCSGVRNSEAENRRRSAGRFEPLDQARVELAAGVSAGDARLG